MRPEEIDQFFNDRLEALSDTMPPTSWVPEATFHKIQQKMKPTKRRTFIPWYVSLAASVSLVALVAGGVYFLQSLPYQTVQLARLLEETTEKSLNQPDVMQDAWLTQKNAPIILHSVASDGIPPQTPSSESLLAANPQGAASSQQLIPSVSPSEVHVEVAPTELPCVEVVAPETVAEKMVQKRHAFTWNHPLKGKEEYKAHAQHQFQVNLLAGAAVVANSVAPVAQVETRWLTSSAQQSSKWTTYSGALSIEGLLTNAESGIEVSPHVFAEVSTGSFSKNEEKAVRGKGVSVGILLNLPDGSSMTRDTFRLRYTWELKNRIRISPELLVGDGFQRVYPGIRITKG